jgi:hypothetical protein
VLFPWFGCIYNNVRKMRGVHHTYTGYLPPIYYARGAVYVLCARVRYGSNANNPLYPRLTSASCALHRSFHIIYKYIDIIGVWYCPHRWGCGWGGEGGKMLSILGGIFYRFTPYRRMYPIPTGCPTVRIFRIVVGYLICDMRALYANDLIWLYIIYIHGVWSVRYCVGGGRWVKYWRQWWVMRHARPWEGRGRGAAVGVINIGGRVVGLDSPNYADVRNPSGVTKIYGSN